MDPRTLPKILYIDDTPEARRLVSRVLSREYIILEASDPLSGIELAMDTHPDLILLDINLPQLSGRELAARLKTLLPHTPLVALSAEVSAEARQRALAAGCVGYLTKPIEDIDVFSQQIQSFLRGKREVLSNAVQYQQEFADEVVARLEEKVRELTKSTERNAFLNEQNHRLIADLQRRQHLLETAARVSHGITSILDLEDLLNVTVNTIREEYGFSFSAVFLLEGEWAVLKAAQGQQGLPLLEEGHRVKVDDSTIVGQAVRRREARLARSHQDAPLDLVLLSFSEMALPLIVKDVVLGALSVHSTRPDAFADEDMPALQSLADQVAIAINNAHLLRDLYQANQELLRTKTFEAIATATGEAIHWVGNKSAPIPASARRVREDLLSLVLAFRLLLEQSPETRDHHPLWPALQEILASTQELPPEACHLLPGHLDSILEDLAIIEQSAVTILNMKEDLIGPARLRHIVSLDIARLLRQTVLEMGLPDGVVATHFADALPMLHGDPRQLGQVFNNLIKNAWEALEGSANPQIVVAAQLAEDPGYIQVEVTDNGPGIPTEMLEKIWVTFFTTKGDRGGTGLGLPACLSIINQHEGKITVESEIGIGTTFRVFLPVGAGRST